MQSSFSPIDLTDESVLRKSGLSFEGFYTPEGGFDIDEGILADNDGEDKNDFSKDRRIHVADVFAFPYSAILYMRMYETENDLEKETFVPGSAFMIGERIALTAAHNVCYRGKGEITPENAKMMIPRQVICFSCMNDGDFHEMRTVVSLALNFDYYNSEGKFRKYDYAILLLDKPFAVRSYLAPIVHNPEMDTFTISGYPRYAGVGEENSKQKTKCNGNLYSCEGPLVDFKTLNDDIQGYIKLDAISVKKNVGYKIDTSPGQSGSPIIHELKSENNHENAPKSQFCAVGIHTGGMTSPACNFNRGVPITNNVLQFLIKAATYLDVFTQDTKEADFQDDHLFYRIIKFDSKEVFLARFK